MAHRTWKHADSIADVKITQGFEKKEGHTDYQYSSQCSDTK